MQKFCIFYLYAGFKSILRGCVRFLMLRKFSIENIRHFDEKKIRSSIVKNYQNG